MEHLELRELVETVVDIVLQEYRPQPPKGLIIMTGGGIGRDTAFQELHKLRQQGWDLRAVFTPVGGRVTGPERLRKLLPGLPIIEEGAAPYPLVQWADLLFLPVLTINTAAKLAALVADNLAATCVLEALLMGKPVLAASDAAAPGSPERVRLGMDRGRPALRERLEHNLATLEGYGVEIVRASEIAAAACSLVQGGRNRVADFAIGQGLVTAADVLQAAADGCAQIRVSPRTLITPLARERAHELGIIFTTTEGED